MSEIYNPERTDSGQPPNPDSAGGAPSGNVKPSGKGQDRAAAAASREAPLKPVAIDLRRPDRRSRAPKAEQPYKIDLRRPQRVKAPKKGAPAPEAGLVNQALDAAAGPPSGAFPDRPEPGPAPERPPAAALEGPGSALPPAAPDGSGPAPPPAALEGSGPAPPPAARPSPITVLERPSPVLPPAPRPSPITVLERPSPVLPPAPETSPITVLERPSPGGRPPAPETSPATILEGPGRGRAPEDGARPATVLERPGAPAASGAGPVPPPGRPAAPLGRLATFRGHPAERLPAAGAEADIYVLTTPEGRRVLKLYRYGVNPKEDVLAKIAEIASRHSSHVVQLFESGFDAETGCWFELMEYVEHGSLADLLASGEARNLDFSAVLSELCEAIDALQGSDLVHRDIKPSNILVRTLPPAGPLDLILSDFGIASIMHDVSVRATARNFTPEYAPPEMDVASKAGDWWSLGIILYEILTGGTPFRGLEQSAIIVTLATKPVDIPASLDDRLKLLLKGLLTRDIDRRWRAAEVREWLAGGSPRAWYDSEAAGVNVAEQLPPFRFMNRDYGSLRELALAMASSDENWRAGVKYQARGYLSDMLQKRGQFDDENIIDAFKFGSDDEFVFMFTSEYGGLDRPYYRGLALTLENVFAAVQVDHPAAGSVEADFVSRTLNEGWDAMLSFWFEGGKPQGEQDFLNLIFYNQFVLEKSYKINNTQKLKNILNCYFNQDKFFWGLLPDNQFNYTYNLQKDDYKSKNIITISCICQTRFLQAVHLKGHLMTIDEYNNIGGTNIIITQSIANKLGDITQYYQGVKDLKNLIASRRFLTINILSNANYTDAGNGIKVFIGTDTEYEDTVQVKVFNYDANNIHIIRETINNLQEFDKTTYTVFLALNISFLLSYCNLLLRGNVVINNIDISICRRIIGYIDNCMIYCPAIIFLSHIFALFYKNSQPGYLLTVSGFSTRSKLSIIVPFFIIFICLFLSHVINVLLYNEFMFLILFLFILHIILEHRALAWSNEILLFIPLYLILFIISAILLNFIPSIVNFLIVTYFIVFLVYTILVIIMKILRAKSNSFNTSVSNHFNQITGNINP